MKRIPKKCILFSLFIITLSCHGQSSVNSLLSRLNEVIDNREYFVRQKQDRLDEIKKEFLFDERNYALDVRYNYFLAMSMEYQTFKFDSAFHYSIQLIDAAYRGTYPDKIVKAQIDFANIQTQ